MTGRNVVVCSEHAHSSVEKDARMLGMELRKVPVDDELRMRSTATTSTTSPCVVATVGTTSFASVDPVRELAERAHAAGAWLHVDAAYAGSSWICEEERWSADGVELADSLVDQSAQMAARSRPTAHSSGRRGRTSGARRSR